MGIGGREFRLSFPAAGELYETMNEFAKLLTDFIIDDISGLVEHRASSRHEKASSEPRSGTQRAQDGQLGILTQNRTELLAMGPVVDPFA
jgi:hypothetical protein